MIRHRYGSSRSFRGLEFSEDFLLIGHFIFVLFLPFITTKFPIVPASSRLSPVSTCGTGRKVVAKCILIFLFVSFSVLYSSQLTDFSVYRLAEVEVTALYSHIPEIFPSSMTEVGNLLSERY
ncbi:hypothetical protein T4B_5240 [Trichinella pseudospiralis]|uniref:Uncharacterized protein n=1 Tax=Trichinella pseudospiralis TaxID=6337 RepID=A0A0V1IGI3_TRIPS|nr:hypothetical protein T4B_5240 [Trichinella pseudospiralis]